MGKIKRQSQRFLSIFLIFIMLFSLIPVPVGAVEGNTSEDEQTEVMIESSSEDILADEEKENADSSSNTEELKPYNDSVINDTESIDEKKDNPASLKTSSSNKEKIELSNETVEDQSGEVEQLINDYQQEDGSLSSKLSRLTIDQGIGEVDVSKSPNRFYLDADVDKITVTPIVENKNATIKIAGQEVINGEPHEIELKEGSNLKVLTTFDEKGSQESRIVYNFYRSFKYSPTRVTEYLPAPGQFINREDWALNPQKILVGGGGVSLGAFGGYVIFEFDEPIKNDSNNPYGVDLIIYGNAFKGNEEPGGIQVMSESDDTWYEIAGSEHYEDDTIIDYEVTYTNPDPEFSEGAVGISWKDNQGETGEVKTNRTHTQPYFPNPENYNTDTLKISGEELTFSGVKLKEKAPAFGYVDVYPNGSNDDQATNPYTSNQAGAPIDIEWAVDQNGQPANIDDIKYVKVYTSMLRDGGAIGEVSTEVTKVARTKAEANIGETDDLSEIKLQAEGNEITVDLEPNKYVYDIHVPAESVSVLASGDADNLYINNDKVELETASKSISLEAEESRTIRVIAQNDKDNPKIYYLNVKQGEETTVPEVDKSKLEKAIVDAENATVEGKSEQSIKGLTDAIIAGKTILENAESTQEEIDAAVNAVQSAINNLEDIKVNKENLADLIDEAEAVNLDEVTDESGKDLQAALEEAENILADANAIQNEVDRIAKLLEKAISNLKERAPPVTVDVRIETNNKTLVPKTKLTLESFDVMEYINGNRNENSLTNDSPRVIHAIIRALETIDAFDLKTDLGLGYGGNYISHICNIGEGGMGGWMYYVDNSYATVGVGEYELENGDSIVLYYTENFMDNTFSWFNSESYSTKVGESLEVELTGNKLNNIDTVEGATILVNEEDYEIDGEVVLTNQDGKIDLVFDEPGTYHLSAKRVNDSGEINIVRPYAIVEVSEDDIGEEEPADKEPPVITVDGIKDGQRVIKDKVNFTVEAKDKVDGIVDATVELNEKVIKPNKAGKFDVQLNKGKNTIVVEATDNSDNTATKTLTVTYEPVELKHDLETAIDKTAAYILKNGISSDWEAIGLVRAGKEIPSSYLKQLKATIKEEITDSLKDEQFKITDAERLAIATAAVGKDPQNISGHDLLELIYNSPDKKLWDESIVDTMTYQGNNGLAFALLALDTNNYTVPEDAKWSRQAIIDELLQKQLDNGSWSLNELHAEPSVDVTAMVLTGLASYQNQSEVKNALDKAVNYLSKAQVAEGGFDGGTTVGGITSEATAQVIIGLTAYGIDPTSEQFTKEGINLVDHLLSYQTNEGGFAHTHDNPSSDDMATEQALLALVAFELFVKGEGRLYDFSSTNAVIKPEKTEEKNDEKDDNIDKINDEKLPVEKDDDVEVPETVKQEENDNTLPKTATNSYNLLLAGFLLLILGSTLFVIRKKRT